MEKGKGEKESWSLKVQETKKSLVLLVFLVFPFSLQPLAFFIPLILYPAFACVAAPIHVVEASTQHFLILDSFQARSSSVITI